MKYEESLQRLAQAITDADLVVAITGAGCSTDSGIRDYRGDDGIWREIDPVQSASLSVFQQDPKQFWELYRTYLHMDDDYQPNTVHLALQQLERYGLKCIITQNIDGLHQAAGSSRVLEVHGNPRQMECLRCGETYAWQEGVAREDDDRVPRCSHGHPLKPSVILFGEQLPQVAHRAMAWCHDSDLVLAVGTSLQVSPVCDWVELNGTSGSWKPARYAVLNNQPTPKDAGALAVLREPLAKTFTDLLRLLGD